MIVVEAPELEKLFPFGAEYATTIEILIHDILEEIQVHMVGYFVKKGWAFIIVFARDDYFFKIPADYWIREKHRIASLSNGEKVNWAKEGF